MCNGKLKTKEIILNLVAFFVGVWAYDLPGILGYSTNQGEFWLIGLSVLLAFFLGIIIK